MKIRTTVWATYGKVLMDVFREDFASMWLGHEVENKVRKCFVIVKM